MRVNPFADAIEFLTRGGWVLAVFWLLLVGSIVLAIVNIRQDKAQRTAFHTGNWLLRLLIGCMWWQQSLWKMPPTYTDQPDGSGGLPYWVGQMADNAAFGLQSDFVKNIVQPHFNFFAPQVYFGEVFIALSLMLGLFTRLGGLLGALLALNLWLGLYRLDSEWPWTYFFLFVIQVLFVMYRPGRSLGADAVLVRRVESSLEGGLWDRLVRLVS